MAVVSQLLCAVIIVFEKDGLDLRRIAVFDLSAIPGGMLSLLYVGRMHYDALTICEAGVLELHWPLSSPILFAGSPTHRV